LEPLFLGYESTREALSAAEHHQAGRRFEPKEARQMLELAAFFEPRLLPRLAKLLSEQPPETSFRRIEQLFPWRLS
jgi:hypothetical protein